MKSDLVILRMFTLQELGEMYPPAKGARWVPHLDNYSSVCCRNQHEWFKCTREHGHKGPHIAHQIGSDGVRGNTVHCWVDDTCLNEYNGS